MHDHVRYCVLMSLVVVHIISATSEVISVKALNYDADVRLPIYFALMVNAYWIVWAPLYFAGRACKFPKHRMSWQRVRSYCLIAAVGTPVTLLRMHGLNSIPGTVYVVISTADLVFSALLQKLMFPERRMTMFHSLAIVLCCGAIVLVALGSEESTTFVCDGDSCLDDYAVGIFAGLGSAFLNACQIALADKLLEDKPEKGVRLQQPSANGRHGSASVLRVSEMMLFNGLIGSLILPVLLLFSGEATAWGDTFESVSNQGLGSLLVTLSLVLCFGKLLDRTAFFFVLVDTLRRMITALLVVVFLDEHISYNKLMGLAMSAIGVVCYGYGSHLNKVAKEELDQARVAMHASVELGDAVGSSHGAPKAPPATRVASRPGSGSGGSAEFKGAVL